MEKRYWDPSDYKEAVRYIKYIKDKEEANPRLSDPETAPVFLKFVDKENISVILEDESLGLNYRSKVSSAFFDEIKELYNVYLSTDIQDKFIYSAEIVEITDFMLHFQLLYFRIGNEEILNDALDPDDSRVLNNVNRNRQILIDNFSNYIDFISREQSFTDEDINRYAEIVRYYFTELFKTYPHMDYADIKNTSKKLLNKVESKELQETLEYIIKKIEATN